VREKEIKRVLREIGARVKVKRQTAGLTQEEAAAIAGIDYKRWQRLELGSVNPTVRTLARAAEALGCTIWELLGSPPLPRVARQTR
jgi:transcriptional regulator with XRE-family HTH domain